MSVMVRRDTSGNRRSRAGRPRAVRTGARAARSARTRTRDLRQAAHRQADLAGFRPEHPLAVGPAVAQCVVHALQYRAIGAHGADDASDSAHGYTPGGTSWSVFT